MSEVLDYKGNKSFRILNINERLNKGEFVNNSELAMEYNVTEKTIQEDIDDLRLYFAKTHSSENETVIKYDKAKKGYYLINFSRECMTNEEVLAVSKILLESRAFCKKELDGLLSKIVTQATINDKKQVEDIIRNEQFYYAPLKHNKMLLSPIWEISKFITNQEIISFTYTRQDDVCSNKLIKPVSIVFSEYYFYLIGFMADNSKDYPIIFRIDRMENLKGTGIKFNISYLDKLKDDEFRQGIQLMYSGELHTVKFEYTGVIEAVFDRLPTAKVIKEDNGVRTVTAEVYANGIDMWLKSQGDKVRVIK
ncbi:MAG: WYL domain-containing protein [Oscillospiraceae bacterium]